MSIRSACQGTGDINREEEEEAAESSRAGLRRVLSPKAEKDNLISERDTTSFHAALFGQPAASFTCTLRNSPAPKQPPQPEGGGEVESFGSDRPYQAEKKLGMQGKASRQCKRRAARARRGKATLTACPPSRLHPCPSIPAHLTPSHLKAKRSEGRADTPRYEGYQKLHATELFPFTSIALQIPVQPRQAILRQ